MRSHENPKVSPFVRRILDRHFFGSGLKRELLHRSSAVVDGAKLKRKGKLGAGLGELHHRYIVRQRIAHPANPGRRTRSCGPTEQASANCRTRQEHRAMRAEGHGIRIFVSGRMAYFEMNGQGALPLRQLGMSPSRPKSKRLSHPDIGPSSLTEADDPDRAGSEQARADQVKSKSAPAGRLKAFEPGWCESSTSVDMASGERPMPCRSK